MKTETRCEMLETLNAVRYAIEAENGRRRTRIADHFGILTDTALCYHAGHVSNSYGYRATATAIAVVPDSEGNFFAHVREVSATKGSSGFGNLLRNAAGGIKVNGSDELIRTGLPVPSNSQALARIEELRAEGLNEEADTIEEFTS